MIRMLPLAKSEEALLARPALHHPVLLSETLELLAPRSGDVVVDATLGAGGHAESLLEAIAPGGTLLGIDRDPAALKYAGERLARFGQSFKAIHGNHADLRQLMESSRIETVDRILFDLGLSSIQLDDAQRGFAIRTDGPLDMRMDPTSGRAAREIVAEADERELAGLLWRFGEERRSRAIARAIVAARAECPIETTSQLAQLVERVLGPAARRYRIHPATRSFQALRIAVNGELEYLESAIADAVTLLQTGGRLAVVSFHSLEDRIVKKTFRGLANRCSCPPRLPVCGCGKKDQVRIVTKKIVTPTDDEIGSNPRARSAKLRVVEKL